MSAQPQETLTEFEVQLSSFLEQRYQLTGQLLTAEKALEEFGIPVGKFNAAFEKQAFKDSLVERGIILERFQDTNESWTKSSLTPTQLVVANAMLDAVDTRSQKKKLQDLGISTAKYNAWLNDPVFQEYLHNKAQRLLGANAHEADMALMDKVRAGDTRAIAYYNEMTGRYTDELTRARIEQAKAGPANANNIDIHGILVRVIEIINEEIDDKETMDAISNRIRGLIGANAVAHALTNPEQLEITQPEVVKIRQIPKELGNGDI